MKILITGGTGFIGRHLIDFWQQSNHHITILARRIECKFIPENIGCLEADITLEEDIQAAIIFLKPDVVIHTAAMSKPNDCEADKTQCYLTNVTATEYIIEVCKMVGAKLIFLSTDFVFGNNGPYGEADNYEPVNYYGQCKMEAEKAILISNISYAIVRTGLVVGAKLNGQANTFLHWVKDSLEAQKTIRLYTDQQRSPTYVINLCSGINAIIENGFTGTIHLSGSQTFTPYSLARQVALYLGLNQQLLVPITYQQQPEPAMRPQNAVLKIDKAVSELGYTATPFNEILKAVFSK